MRILSSYFLLVFVCIAIGQPKDDNFELEAGPFFKVDKRSVPTEFIGNDASGFYLTYSKGKGGQGERSLAKFGYNLQLKEELRLSQSIDGSMAYSTSIFILNNKMYHILQATSNSSKKIYLQEVDHQQMQLTESPQLITTIDDVKNAYNASTSVHFAKDSAYFMVAYSIPTKKKDWESLGIHVFNKQVEEQWSQHVELPYTNKLLDITTYRVDREGNAYLLGKRFFDKRKERLGDEVNYDYLLFRLDPSGSIDSTRIESEGKYLTDMQVDFTDEGDIVSAGFYSDQSSTFSGGAFYLKLDGTTKQPISSSFRPFDDDLLTQNMTKGKAKKTKKKIEKGKDVELPYYYIDEFIINPDGSTRVIAERRSIYVTQTYMQNGGIITNTHYDYTDIMVLKISADGVINWAQRVAKNQQTVNDGAVYSSYSLAKKGDDLFLLFNDNAQNLNYTGTGKVAAMAKGTSTIVMAHRLDTDGNSKRMALFTRGEVGAKIRPALCKQIGYDEMLLFGHKGLKTQRFVLLKFK